MDHSALHELQDLLQSYESEQNHDSNSIKPSISHPHSTTGTVTASSKGPNRGSNSREKQRQSMENDIQELLDIVRTQLDTPNSTNCNHPNANHPTKEKQPVAATSSKSKHSNDSKGTEKTFWNDMLDVLSHSNTDRVDNNIHPSNVHNVHNLHPPNTVNAVKSRTHHSQSKLSKSKAKSTGNLFSINSSMDGYPGSDSTEDVLLNTPLLNSKDETVNTVINTDSFNETVNSHSDSRMDQHQNRNEQQQQDRVYSANLMHHSQSAVHLNNNHGAFGNDINDHHHQGLKDRDTTKLENRPFADNIDYKRMEQRVESKVDEFCAEKEILSTKQEHHSKKRIRKLQDVAKQYLDKNGCRMRNDVRQEFLQDFRDSVDQIRAKMRKEYSTKIANLTHDFNRDLKSELDSYRDELKYQYQHNVEDIKGRMLAERAQKMKQIRDKHDHSTSAMLQKLQNELELENEARLSQLQNIMTKERESQIKNLKSRLQNTFQCRYKDLRDELSRNKQNECDMIQTTMKSDYERRCADLKQETVDKLDRFKVDLKNDFAQKTVDMKLKMTATYDSECKLIRERLFAKNQKLRDDMKAKMDLIHRTKVKEIERESEALTFRMTEENKVNLDTQQRELQQLKVEKVNLIKEHCFKEFNKMYEANKINAESDFQKEKLAVMEALDKEFKLKTRNDIDAMRKDFEEKHKSVLSAYRDKLEIAAKADISREKEVLKKKEKESMDKLEAKFSKQKKRWMDKVNGAAVIDKKNALKKLHSKLEKEKKKSIEEMCAKIQREKQLAIDEMKREHEAKKLEKFESIRTQYMMDPDMQEDIKLVDLRTNMEEEIDLMDRFSMFMQRIKSLQDQIRATNESMRPRGIPQDQIQRVITRISSNPTDRSSPSNTRTSDNVLRIPLRDC